MDPGLGKIDVRGVGAAGRVPGLPGEEDGVQEP